LGGLKLGSAGLASRNWLPRLPFHDSIDDTVDGPIDKLMQVFSFKRICWTFSGLVLHLKYKTFKKQMESVYFCIGGSTQPPAMHVA